MAPVVPPDVAGVSAPPARLHLDPFYTKYADAQGIPVTSSSLVPDEALLATRDIVNAMLAHRPDVRDELVRQGARVGVMAVSEGTMDLPEQRDWKKPAIDDPRLTKCEVRDYAKTIALMTDREYWNARSRGMGGLFTTGAEENIMGVPKTRYFGENIMVHEFSHNIMWALRTTDPALIARLEKAYAHAREKRLWQGAYMANTLEEYWAEGTQFWFNSNKAYITDTLTVVNAQDLQAHDPEIYALLAEVYGDNHHIKADVFYMHAARMDSARVSLDASGKAKNDCYS
ncbi:glycoside hydrolase [Duganella ginsengisoli]|uniref:Glycoside hydrolase n=1 Tax=Pseudoduganella ginsengisoli TaxID=1462440 RepID=A0A6L6Q6M7_9BURK|nr:glycoside hydrolase [Pseudoduganella ginsengisoli]